MSIPPGFMGIDVSKHHLDIFDSSTNQTTRIANTAEAVSALIAGLCERTVSVTFEATGRHDRLLYDGLVAAGIRFCRVNPARARAFANAIGTLAKTDAIDARMLAAFGALPQTARRPDQREDQETTQSRRRLCQVHRRRDQLVAMRQQERLRLGEATRDERHSLERHITWLTDEIRDLEAQRAALIAQAAAIGNQHRLLRSVPGIGPVAATTLIAMMPELGQRPPKTIAALAGLAPFNVDSGQFRGKRTIRGGRKRVRDALYIAALTAWRTKSQLGRFAANLIDKGKPFKLAIIALARKILTIANAIIRDQKAYQP